jgi:hypothetical protein
MSLEQRKFIIVLTLKTCGLHKTEQRQFGTFTSYWTTSLENITRLGDCLNVSSPTSYRADYLRLNQSTYWYEIVLFKFYSQISSILDLYLKMLSWKTQLKIINSYSKS